MCLPKNRDGGSLILTGGKPAIAARAGKPETGVHIGRK